MTIYFVSQQSEICHLMANLFPEHICLVFSSLEYFTTTMQSLKDYPDLVVADFLLLNHDIYNIYTERESKKARVPVIFFNDPCLTSFNHTSHWITYLQCVHAKFTLNELEKFQDIFEKLNDFVENPEYSQYISLMQKPKPFPKAMCISRFYEPENTDDAFKTLKNFQRKTNMKQSIFNIIEILYEKPEEFMDFNEILCEYSKKYEKLKPESLKVKLSQLKTFLENQKNPPAILLKKQDGYKLMFM